MADTFCPFCLGSFITVILLSTYLCILQAALDTTLRSMSYPYLRYCLSRSLQSTRRSTTARIVRRKLVMEERRAFLVITSPERMFPNVPKTGKIVHMCVYLGAAKQKYHKYMVKLRLQVLSVKSRQKCFPMYYKQKKEQLTNLPKVIGDHILQIRVA